MQRGGKMFRLCRVEPDTSACRLPLCQRVVYLIACIEQLLAKVKECFFLSGFGYLQIGYVFPFIKQRLDQRTYG